MEIRLITKENSEIFDVFAQNYEAEFSSTTQKKPQKNGHFIVDSDWREPSRGYLLFVEELPAGFIIRGEVEQRSDVAEFYILPCFRRKGLGKQLAFATFEMHPGPWQVRQIQGLDYATAFWRATIREYTDDNYREDIVSDSHYGTVIRQLFEA